MQRRDVITVAGISVIALVSALVLGPMFRAGEGEFAGPLPVPRTPVLPDPVRPPPVPPLLTVAVVDAVSGANINDGAALELFLGTNPEAVAGARGLRFDTPLQVQKCPQGVPLQLRVRRERYLPSPAQAVTTQAGSTVALEIRLQPLHRVTVRPQGTVSGALLGVAQVWPLPQWPEDRPLVRWAEPWPEGFEFQLPAGRYICCAPLQNLTRDVQGRPWLTAFALANAPDFAVPSRCNWGVFEVSGPATISPSLDAAVGTLTLSGQVSAHDGSPQAGQYIELVRLGPIRQVAGTRASDGEGRFEFTGLAPGTYQARPASTPGQWPWVEVEANHTVKLVLPEAPPATKGELGSVQVQVTRRGEAVGGSQLVLLGSFFGDGFVPSAPGTLVGRSTGLAGLVQWEQVLPGRYRVTASVATTTTMDLEIRGGIASTATLEIAPPGSGELQVVGLWDELEWALVEDLSGNTLCEGQPGSHGAFRAYGLPVGKLNFRFWEVDKASAVIPFEVFADRVTAVQRPPHVLPPAPPEDEAPRPVPVIPPQPPKEEPPPEQDDGAKPNGPGNPSDDRPSQSHDRPTDGVSLKLPAPAGDPTIPPSPAEDPPRPVEKATPLPQPPIPVMPTRRETISGPVLRIVLEIAPTSPDLWRAVLVADDAQCALFDTVARGNGRIQAGLCELDGKPVLTLRGEFSDLREITVQLPGHQPLKIAIPQATQEVQAKPQKR